MFIKEAQISTILKSGPVTEERTNITTCPIILLIPIYSI